MANTENMTKWAEALESGEYEQGTRALAIIELHAGSETGKVSYCCLGVACEVAMKNGVELRKTKGYDGGQLVWMYDGESGVLPPKVQEWLDLDLAGAGNPEFQEGSATELNDDAGFTFGELADQVRVTYLPPA